ncbi:MAG: 3-dehydroquinate synthase [bacterium P3]|nr:MAG: 3-dehydroquinate synthase [bacterium P3]KWW41062.1 MAG: 3-dehydroquinate synthase [bacterium F083]
MASTRIISSVHRSSLAGLGRMLQAGAYRHARYFILLDENTFTHCLPRLVASVPALHEAEFIELPVGEAAKTIETAGQVWCALMDSGADADSVLVNLGGGCVSDVGGFVAAGYQRGIRYINVPTTLLAMVDAAVGGKTAVNLQGVKNQVGFFHPPAAVCIHPVFLDTLPAPERLSGRFEMLKSQLVGGDAVAAAPWDTALDSPPPASLIVACARFKASVCRADPHDSGVRRILNFGHTFGHALESFLARRGCPVPHGAAVAMGMWCELYLSVGKLHCVDSLLHRYEALVRGLLDVPRITLADTESLLQLMRHDKKCADGTVRCVLLKEPGLPVIDVPLDDNEIRDALLKLHHQLRG